jgi:hypothetical protein
LEIWGSLPFGKFDQPVSLSFACALPMRAPAVEQKPVGGRLDERICGIELEHREKGQRRCLRGSISRPPVALSFAPVGRVSDARPNDVGLPVYWHVDAGALGS